MVCNIVTKSYVFGSETGTLIRMDLKLLVKILRNILVSCWHVKIHQFNSAIKRIIVRKCDGPLPLNVVGLRHVLYLSLFFLQKPAEISKI
jgi:hypothetical protein